MSWMDFWKKKPHKIGLAFSGGAIHGAAHIGVIQVLEREGISADIVTGASAGAIIGAAYSAGVSTDDMVQMFKKASWPNLVRFSWKNTLSLFDTQPLEQFIETIIGKSDFNQLNRRFACVACDIMTGERIILDHGPVGLSVRASAAFPGVLSPVEIDGRLLVDGGVVDNLPAGLAREMGADYIIAVDLSTPTRLIHRPSNPLEILLAVTNLMQTNSALPDPKLVNCLIRPDVEEFAAWDFGDVDELEARGRSAAELVINRLKSDLGKK